MSEETRTYNMTVPQGGAFGFHLEYVGINLDTYTASFRVGRTSDDLYESDVSNCLTYEEAPLI